MDAVLETLQELEGVSAAVVADSTGRVLAYRAHTTYDAPVLEHLSRSVVIAIDSVKVLHRDWESITVQFAEGKLFIRSLSFISPAKTSDLTLSVVADKRLNLPFAGAALRVAVAKLKDIVAVSAARASRATSEEALSTGFAAKAAKDSAPEIEAEELGPGLVAELEKYLEDLAGASDGKNVAPKIP